MTTLPLTYHCQSEIFKFFEVLERRELAKWCPEVRKRHRKFPLRLKELEIDKPYDEYWFTLDRVAFTVRKHYDDPRYVRVLIRERRRILRYSLKDVIERLVDYFLNRQGTKIVHLKVKKCSYFLEYSLPLEIQKLTVYCDTPPENFNIVSKATNLPNLKELKIWGDCIYKLMESDYILSAEKVKVKYPKPEVQALAKQKFVKAKHLTFSFDSLVPNYHSLSQQILDYSLLNKPIGNIFDILVFDSFNFKNYPNFSVIYNELKAKKTEKTEVNDRLCLTIPMTDAELNIFIIPYSKLEWIYLPYDKAIWILRMEVMEKGTATIRKRER